MNRTVSKPAFFLAIGCVVAVIVVGVVWYISRPASAGAAASSGSAGDGLSGPTTVAARSHPGETKEQRRARVLSEHRPMRRGRDED